MKVINPCKKCLVKACCTQVCDESYEHSVFKTQVYEIVTYIPYTIKSIYKGMIDIYIDEHIGIKILVTILITMEVCLIGILTIQWSLSLK